MTYTEKYPLYIKSADYGDIDLNADEVKVTVTYADDSVVTYSTLEGLIAVHQQMQEQQEALNNGEEITYSPK